MENEEKKSETGENEEKKNGIEEKRTECIYKDIGYLAEWCTHHNFRNPNVICPCDPKWGKTSKTKCPKSQVDENVSQEMHAEHIVIPVL